MSGNPLHKVLTELYPRVDDTDILRKTAAVFDKIPEDVLAYLNRQMVEKRAQTLTGMKSMADLPAAGQTGNSMSDMDTMKDFSKQQNIGTGFKVAGTITQAGREGLKTKEFAIPQSATKKKGIVTAPKGKEKGRYPIDTEARARSALAYVSQHGTPQEKEMVRRKVYARYPELKAGYKARHGVSPTSKAVLGKDKISSRMPSPVTKLVKDEIEYAKKHKGPVGKWLTTPARPGPLLKPFTGKKKTSSNKIEGHLFPQAKEEQPTTEGEAGKLLKEIRVGPLFGKKKKEGAGLDMAKVQKLLDPSGQMAKEIARQEAKKVLLPALGIGAAVGGGAGAYLGLKKMRKKSKKKKAEDDGDVPSQPGAFYDALANAIIGAAGATAIGAIARKPPRPGLGLGHGLGRAAAIGAVAGPTLGWITRDTLKEDREKEKESSVSSHAEAMADLIKNAMIAKEGLPEDMVPYIIKAAASQMQKLSMCDTHKKSKIRPPKDKKAKEKAGAIKLPIKVVKNLKKPAMQVARGTASYEASSKIGAGWGTGTLRAGQEGFSALRKRFAAKQMKSIASGRLQGGASTISGLLRKAVGKGSKETGARAAGKFPGMAAGLRGAGGGAGKLKNVAGAVAK